jgi:hypothetical protein
VEVRDMNLAFAAYETEALAGWFPLIAGQRHASNAWGYGHTATGTVPRREGPPWLTDRAAAAGGCSTGPSVPTEVSCGHALPATP